MPDVSSNERSNLAAYMDPRPGGFPGLEGSAAGDDDALSLLRRSI
jgi:hypothetical protein